MKRILFIGIVAVLLVMSCDEGSSRYHFYNTFTVKSGIDAPFTVQYEGVIYASGDGSPIKFTYTGTDVIVSIDARPNILFVLDHKNATMWLYLDGYMLISDSNQLLQAGAW